LIGYADTGFLVSLYGQDYHSAAASALVTSKPVLILTSLGEAEFTNAVELRVFGKEPTLTMPDRQTRVQAALNRGTLLLIANFGASHAASINKRIFQQIGRIPKAAAGG